MFILGRWAVRLMYLRNIDGDKRKIPPSSPIYYIGQTTQSMIIFPAKTEHHVSDIGS